MNRSLFAALKLEKIAMFIILTLIILVAAFGIASTLFMMVMKKTRDIAILKSMGATRQSIMQIFIINGLVIGGLGTIGGLGLGLGLCAILKKYQFIKLPQDVYYISTLPVTVQCARRAGHHRRRHGHQLFRHPLSGLAGGPSGPGGGHPV